MRNFLILTMALLASCARAEKREANPMSTFSTRTVLVTANYAVEDNDFLVLGDASGGALTMTLKAAAGRRGRMWIVGKDAEDDSENAITVNVNGGGLINGASTLTLTAPGECYVVQAVAGGKYRVVSSNFTGAMIAAIAGAATATHHRTLVIDTEEHIGEGTGTSEAPETVWEEAIPTSVFTNGGDRIRIQFDGQGLGATVSAQVSLRDPDSGALLASGSTWSVAPNEAGGDYAGDLTLRRSQYSNETGIFITGFGVGYVPSDTDGAGSVLAPVHPLKVSNSRMPAGYSKDTILVRIAFAGNYTGALRSVTIDHLPAPTE